MGPCDLLMHSRHYAFRNAAFLHCEIMASSRSWLSGLMALMVLLLLSGCAGLRIIDSTVLAVVDAPVDYPWSGASYHFERLPSQRDSPEFAIAERQAEQALSAVGLVRRVDGRSGGEAAADTARLSVLLGFQGVQYAPGPWGRSGFGEVFVTNSAGVLIPGGSGWGIGLGLNLPPPPRFRREVSLIIRDLKSGRVVYETRASHDGPWPDSETVFATLFKAALAGFPRPPAGLQRVDIEIAR